MKRKYFSPILLDDDLIDVGEDPIIDGDDDSGDDLIVVDPDPTIGFGGSQDIFEG